VTCPGSRRDPPTRGVTPAIEAGPPVFGPADPPRRDPATVLFGAPPSLVPPGSDPPTLRSQGARSRHPRPTPARQAPPLFGTMDPPRGTRRRSSSEPRPPPSPDPAPRFFGIGSPRPLGSVSRPSGRGFQSPGWSRSYAPRISGDRGRRGHRFRPALPRRAGRQRQEGNGRSDAFPAADEGNSSEGANCTAGTDPCTRPPSGDPLQARMKRGEPSTGCGVQQTRNSHAEKTVEVVRNHEDGTRTGTRRRRSDGNSLVSLLTGLLPGVDACEVHRWQGPQSHERRNQRKSVPTLRRAL